MFQFLSIFFSFLIIIHAVKYIFVRIFRNLQFPMPTTVHRILFAVYHPMNSQAKQFDSSAKADHSKLTELNYNSIFNRKNS